MANEPSWTNLSKREKLQITRQRAKLEKILGSISDLTRLPAALFVVDVLKEKIAVREAQKLGIPIFAMVDTNSNPEDIDFVIPANDDASQSIKLVVGIMTDAVLEGLNERKFEKEKEEADAAANRLAKKKAKEDAAAAKQAEAEAKAKAKSDEKTEDK
jgi:small subunit ribosomal protein S2